ncbi:hypothetical protein BVRB_1g004270 [Beta vulgaris subsp. vulgaris]|nr:hypothetical protein BVRB_1g004270 [Beta vulgaris subsp. vulgaris]
MNLTINKVLCYLRCVELLILRNNISIFFYLVRLFV